MPVICCGPDLRSWETRHDGKSGTYERSYAGNFVVTMQISQILRVVTVGSSVP
jgi:hypothetical protein